MKLRALHVIRSANPALGGPIQGLHQFARFNIAAGGHTEVACLDGEDAPWISKSDLKVHALGPAAGTYGYHPEWTSWIRCHASEYDVVVIHGIWQYHSFGTWRALRGTGVPYVAFTHGMLGPWFKQQYPAKHIKKWMYWPWADYRVLRDAARVLFTCAEEQRLAAQSFWLYRANPTVIGYGTTAPTGDPAEQLRAVSRAFPQLQQGRFALFVGRLHPVKGCDLLIRAFAQSAGHDPQYRLVMAGPDQIGWRSELEPLARQLGVADRILWTGMVSGDLKRGLFRASDVFALPSHHENFGMSVAEALSHGLPVLISDKVNIWKEVVAARAGFANADTVAGATALFRDWFSLAPEQKQQMRESALAAFQSRFNIDRAAQNFVSVLTSIVQERR